MNTKEILEQVLLIKEDYALMLSQTNVGYGSFVKHSEDVIYQRLGAMSALASAINTDSESFSEEVLRLKITQINLETKIRDLEAELSEREQPDNNMTRDQFMEFFRDEDRLNTLTPDDRIEVFRSIMLGSSDFTPKLLNDILNDYGADHVYIDEGETQKQLEEEREKLTRSRLEVDSILNVANDRRIRIDALCLEIGELKNKLEQTELAYNRVAAELNEIKKKESKYFMSAGGISFFHVTEKKLVTVSIVLDNAKIEKEPIGVSTSRDWTDYHAIDESTFLNAKARAEEIIDNQIA